MISTVPVRSKFSVGDVSSISTVGAEEGAAAGKECPEQEARVGTVTSNLAPRQRWKNGLLQPAGSDPEAEAGICLCLPESSHPSPG